MDTLRQIRLIWKPLVFALCLVPFVLVVTDSFELTGRLGANPVEEILDRFGNWGLRFIMITLAVTPLRRATGWNWLSRFRRMFGLFTFFYVLMHFLTWLILDQGLRHAIMNQRLNAGPVTSIQGSLELEPIAATALQALNG